MANGQLNLANVTDEQFSKLLAIKDKVAGKLSIAPNQALNPVIIGSKPGFSNIVLLFSDAEGFKLAAEVLEMLAT